MITANLESQMMEVRTSTDLYELAAKQEVILEAALEESSKLNGNISHVYTLLRMLKEVLLTPDQMDAINEVVDEHKTTLFIERFNKQNDPSTQQ